MQYFAFIYEYNPLNPRLGDVRPAHREFIGALHAEGKICGSGPFTDSKGGALIVLQFPEGEADVKAAMDIMDKDPFWAEGIVTAREIREWNPVINSFGA